MSQLPTCLKPESADGLIFNEEGRTSTSEANGTDRNGYIEGDVPQGGVLNVGHGCVYIVGDVGEAAQLRGRQGVYCARKASATTVLDGGNLLIVSDETPEEDLLQISANAIGDIPILVVPESERAAVFDILVQNDIRSANCSGIIPTRPLRNLRQELPSVPMSLYYLGQKLDLPSFNLSPGGASASPAR